MLINDQHSVLIGSRRSILTQHSEPAFLHVALVSGRFGEELLQLLRLRMLGSSERLGIALSGQRHVPFTGQEQALQMVAKGLTLITLSEHLIELLGKCF